jgi:uncharacterized membrane protein YphA (DoxX/SURF4 family)
MNILLWILQVLLAAAYMAHGLMFLFPPASVVEAMNATISRPMQLFLGICEVLAALGLILPGLTRIQPRLVPLAAAGLIPIMIGATVLHIQRNEISSAITTAILLVLVAFVAYMRWKVKPILPRRAAAG